MPQPLINATKNESSSQASKSSKIESMRVKTKGMKLDNLCSKISADMKISSDEIDN